MPNRWYSPTISTPATGSRYSSQLCTCRSAVTESTAQENPVPTRPTTPPMASPSSTHLQKHRAENRLWLSQVRFCVSIV